MGLLYRAGRAEVSEFDGICDEQATGDSERKDTKY